jgi:membrane-associated protein
MEALLHLITQFGPFAVLAVIYAETGLLLGFFFPGDSLLFTSGFLVQQGYFNIDIHVFVWLLWAAAVAGESTGYLFGRKVGRKLFQRENTRLFKKERLEAAERFYEKYGSLTIVLAVFVPIVRTFAPIVAGVSKMPYKLFIPFNLLGTFIWTFGFTYLGYYAGAALKEMGINVEVAALIIIFLSISPMVYHALKEPENRTRLVEATRRQFVTIFSSKK